MPIFEYKCKSCSTVVEVIQRSGGRPPRKCAKCSGRMEKMISRAAFILKGGGWFTEGYHKGGATGSKSKGKTDLSGKDSTSTSDTESKSKTKSEPSKPSDK